MNIDKILTSPLINKSELARLMWPGVARPDGKMYNKVMQLHGQRITEKDKQLIEQIIKEHLGGV